MFNCFINQDYPKHLIEWIIVDDGTDKIQDLVLASGIPQIRYFEVPEKMTLGAKRNYMHQFVRGSIIVYMDDDDYYPPERISHAVERLLGKPEALCAGSSEIYIYFKSMNKMIQCGPYNDNHATAGTFAFKTEMLKTTKYEDHAALAEERAFLKGYTIPFVQLDPLKTILVFSHDHNTFDKRKMFDQNQDPRFFKESPKNVNNFIRKSFEGPIKKFFMEDIDGLLEHYEPGRPHMKPDALKQIKEIEESREKMIQEAMAAQKANGPIFINRPGQEPVQLTSEQVVGFIKQLQEHIQALEEKNNQNAKYIGLLQQKIAKLNSSTDDTTQVVDPKLNEQLTEYIAANQSLQNRLLQNGGEISNLKQQNAKLTEECTKINAECTKLSLENSQIVQERIAFRKEYDTLSQEYVKLGQENIAILREYVRVKEQLEPNTTDNTPNITLEPVVEPVLPETKSTDLKSRPEVIVDMSDI
jgi:glycosyltransferase involved in cell wall biosynthesis